MSMQMDGDRSASIMLPHLTRKEVLEALENKIVEITYETHNGPKRLARVTLQHKWIKELDNFPTGFETTREAALFDLHAVNALDIDNNQWITIEINKIKKIQIP